MKSLLKLILFLFFIFSQLKFADAQVLNANNFERKVDSLNSFKGLVSFGIDLNKRNDLLFGLNTKAEFSYFVKQSVLIFAASFNFLEIGGDELIKGGYGHLRLRFMVDRWYNPEVFTQAQLDAIIGLKERYLFGGNMRFRIIDNKNGGIFAGLGSMFEREIWTANGVDPDEPTPYTTVCRETPCIVDQVKLNTYLAMDRKLSKTVDLTVTVYLQAVPDINIQYPRLSGDFTMNFGITRNLKFSINYSGFFDNRPVVPIDKYYFTMNNMITLKW